MTRALSAGTQPSADPSPANPSPAEPLGSPRVAALQRRTLAVLVVSQILGTIGVGVAPSIGVLLAGEATDSEAWAGLARVASTLGAAALGIPLGNLAARRGRRVALSAGWATAALGAAVLVAAAQWLLVVPLFAGLFLFGAGSAVTLQARFAATDLAAPRQKAGALSLVVWVGTLGMVVGPNLGAPGEILGKASGLTTYASAFLIALAFSALAALIVAVFMRPDPLLVADELQASEASARPIPAAVAGSAAVGATSGSGAQRPSHKQGAIRSVIREIRCNRPARAAIIAIVAAQIVMVSLMTMTPMHVLHEGGSVSLVGITISLHILGMYALAPLVGWLTDRFGNRFTMAVGALVLAISLVIPIFWGQVMPLVIVALILLGVGWSFVNVSGSALFARVVTPEARASSQGGVDAMSNLLGATAAFAAGPLMAVSSFAVLSVLGLVALLPLVVVLLGGTWRQLANQPR